MMNTEVKEKWVEALESGRFKQGRTFLNNVTDNTQCCLGVLCIIENVDSVDSPRIFTRKEVGQQETVVKEYRATPDGLKSGAMMTPDLLRRFQISDEQAVKLATMNDSGQSFSDIAKHIRNEL